MIQSFRYRDAGVDISAANRAVAHIKRIARTTFNENVLSEIGSFGGMFSGAFYNARDPVLVASCDGIGTKLKIAFATRMHHTIGYDLVAHCVDDILAHGARPLFFLDYIATGKLDLEMIAQIVDGIARGCREANCVLLGGETAEMPGLYRDGEYDIAGFIVGVVDRSRIIDGKRITAGDIVLGLPSLGLHTNGYSLARKLLFEVAGYQIEMHIPELECTVAEELLKPHKNYLPMLERLIERDGVIKGLAHITGGGLVENIPRILPSNVDALLREKSWPVLPIFKLLECIGNVSCEEMRQTFNLGIGMVIIIGPEHLDLVKDQIALAGEKFHLIGEIIDGFGKVQFV